MRAGSNLQRRYNTVLQVIDSTKAVKPLSTLWHKLLCALFKITDGYELPM
jgi:hypothetical protein